MNNNKRPINLALSSLRFPPMAIASILHRLSGVLLFILIPFLFYFAEKSLQSPTSFLWVYDFFGSGLGKLFIWVFLSALIYHLLAGIRHLMMDIGFGESLLEGRRSAITVIALSILFIFFLGLWLWFPISQA